MTTAPSRAPPAAIQNTCWKAANAGRVSPSTTTVVVESRDATTALATAVPTERNRTLRPFAAAVSVIGVEAMMRFGIAA